MTTLVEKRICEDCGKSKRVGREIKPKGRTCADCQYKNKLAKAKWKYTNDPATRERRLQQYRDNYQKNKAEIIKVRAELLRTNKELRAKQRGYEQAWLERLRADPEKYAEHLEKMRLRKTESMKIPENRIRANENRRICRRKKWESEGRVLEPISMERYRKFNKMPRVEYPIAPLLPFLEQWLVDHTQASLSKESGVPERRIYDYLHIQKTASMISIEKLCHAMNISFDLVYDQSDDLEEILEDGDLCLTNP